MLATLDSQNEIYWLRGFRTSHANLNQRLLIGGYKKNDAWFWKGKLTDTPITNFKWIPGQPDELPVPENCLELANLEVNNWNDIPCDDGFKAGFICEKDFASK